MPTSSPTRTWGRCFARPSIRPSPRPSHFSILPAATRDGEYPHPPISAGGRRGRRGRARVLAATKARHYHGVDLSEPALDLAADNLKDMPFEVELAHVSLLPAAQPGITCLLLKKPPIQAELRSAHGGHLRARILVSRQRGPWLPKKCRSAPGASCRLQPRVLTPPQLRCSGI